MSAVVVRHRGDAAGAFLTFEGATTERCLERIVGAALGADWRRPLAVWSWLTGRRGAAPASFRVRAKRATKAGKNLVTSDAIAEEVWSTTVYYSTLYYEYDYIVSCRVV